MDYSTIRSPKLTIQRFSNTVFLLEKYMGRCYNYNVSQQQAKDIYEGCEE